MIPPEARQQAPISPLVDLRADSHATDLDRMSRSVTYNGMADTDTALARAARFRDRQRAKGLRAATIWIPDIRDPAYRARLDAACRELAYLSPAEADAEIGRAHV